MLSEEQLAQDHIYTWIMFKTAIPGSKQQHCLWSVLLSLLSQRLKSIQDPWAYKLKVHLKEIQKRGGVCKCIADLICHTV